MAGKFLILLLKRVLIMDIEDVVHIHNRILFSNKKKTNPTSCNNMLELYGFMLSEISQVEKASTQMISLICGV